MPKINVLNKKQFDFCNYYLEGRTAEDSYTAAGYETGKMTPAVLRAAASRLLQNKKVKEYLEERQRELEAVTAITREKNLLDTIDVVNECAEQFKINHEPAMANAYYRGMDMINRVMGYYAPEKKEISGGITVNFAVPEPEIIDMGNVIDAELEET